MKAPKEEEERKYYNRQILKDGIKEELKNKKPFFDFESFWVSFIADVLKRIFKKAK